LDDILTVSFFKNLKISLDEKKKTQALIFARRAIVTCYLNPANSHSKHNYFNRAETLSITKGTKAHHTHNIFRLTI